MNYLPSKMFETISNLSLLGMLSILTHVFQSWVDAFLFRLFIFSFLISNRWFYLILLLFSFVFLKNWCFCSQYISVSHFGAFISLLGIRLKSFKSLKMFQSLIKHIFSLQTLKSSFVCRDSIRILMEQDAVNVKGCMYKLDDAMQNPICLNTEQFTNVSNL